MPPLSQALERCVPIKVLVVVAVSEGLEAVDAGVLAGGDAAAYNVFRGLHDLVETLDELVEQSGTARHGVPEQCVHVWPVDLAYDQICRSSRCMSSTCVAPDLSASSTLYAFVGSGRLGRDSTSAVRSA